jgi:hypothetical protein
MRMDKKIGKISLINDKERKIVNTLKALNIPTPAIRSMILAYRKYINYGMKLDDIKPYEYKEPTEDCI